MTLTVTDADFIEAWNRGGRSPQRVSEITGLTVRNVYKRRKSLAERGIIRLETEFIPTGTGGAARAEWAASDGWSFPRVRNVHVDNGVVIVFSDAHYWPGEASTAHKGLLEVCKALKPRRVVANGDIFDGARVSRHDAHGWGRRPSVKEEIEACETRLGEIEDACGGGRCEKDWNIGNHCVRFERSLISKASEFDGLAGFRLQDRFPRWEMAWSLMVNPNAYLPVMIKHRFASSGIHAAYNGTLKGGIHTVSGHTHHLEVKPWGDYRGRRYGVQTGTLADPESASMEYAENNPSPMCSGFAVLTFRDGHLLMPELCEVINGKAIFRGEVVA